MTDDIKKMLEEANKALEEEKGSTENIALREIIKIEREHYYNKGVAQTRLKSIREIISKYGAVEKN